MTSISSFLSSCPKNLEEALQQNLQIFHHIGLPQGGTISVEMGNCQGSRANWNWEKRKITLDNSIRDSIENLTVYFIFELFNAVKTDDFIRAKEESKGVDEFVERVERLEHSSALETQKIATEMLGPGAEFELRGVSHSFCRYYALAQIKGHSQQIAERFFPDQVYKGTFKHSLEGKEQTYLKVLLHEYDFQTDKQRFYQIIEALKVCSQQFWRVLECAAPLFPDCDLRCNLGPTHISYEQFRI